MTPAFNSILVELHYRTLVWLTYRLAATFAIALPLLLMVWGTIRKEVSIVRLLSIYFKSASLLAISLLLLTNQRPIGYLTTFIAPFLMFGSVWFWVDINEELADLPPWRALPLTTKIWRWALSGFCLIKVLTSFISLPCLSIAKGNLCNAWVEAPVQIHSITAKLFNFLFGATWSEPLAAFLGYVALIAYLACFFQWLLIRLPKQGRIAGNF